jgi:hypothetical protein
MKKSLLIASVSALTLFAGNAFALTNGTSYGTAGAGPSSTADGFAQWYITGSAADFCVLGSTSGSSEGNGSNNVSISTSSADIAANSGNSSDARSGATSDGVVQITQLQGVDDKSNSWKAVIRMPHSVCNTQFKVTADSANGGLKYSGTQTSSDSHFTTNMDYKVGVKFGTANDSANASTLTGGDTVLVPSQQPTAGDFHLIFASENSGKLLLSGNYQDNVIIRMTPAI